MKAINEQTGETLILENGQWVPEKTIKAVNDETGEQLILKNGQWETPPTRSYFEELRRQAGLTIRHGVEGALALPNALAEGVRAGMNLIPGVDIPSPTQTVSNLLTDAGVPSPETKMERMVATPSRALAGTGATMGLANTISKHAPEVVQRVSQTLQAAPMAQAVSSVTGGTAQQGAAELGGGPVAQTVAGLTGGMVGSMGVNTAQNLAQKAQQRWQGLGPRAAAEKMVEKSMKDLQPEDVVKLRQLGPEARLVDIDDPNVRALAESVVGPSGKAKRVATEFLGARSTQSTKRMLTDLRKFLGVDKDAYQSTKKLLQERKALSEPFYQSAYRELVKVDDDVTELMSRDFMKTAWKEGVKMARNDPDWPTGITIPEQLAPGKTVPLAALDYTKRALDDKIGSLLRSGENGKARIYQGLKRQLLDNIDSKYPDYKMGRELFSDHSAMLKGIEVGKRILRTDPDEMTDFIADMPASEREMVVVGAMKAISDKLKGTVEGGNAARRLATDIVKERIRPAFQSEEAYQAFVNGMERENVFMRSKGILGGSPTQPRQASTGEYARKAEEITDRPVMGSLKVIRDFFTAQKQIPEKVRDELAEILFLESMAKQGTFSNKTISKMSLYKVPKSKMQDLSNSLMNITATQEQEKP